MPEDPLRPDSPDSPDFPDFIGEARAEVEQSGVEPSATARVTGEAPGDVIDRYRLVEELGEGGMGTVWAAKQSEPVERTIALKVIKLGMDTREVVLRFEAERQALALMDHPFIAKVLDGGATAGGRPYFVMELVAGAPITEFCDAAELELEARLALFTRVCEAVQHAHQKGIIHRDIKPSNVLVAQRDGVPEPKVIDFGIAKATEVELTKKTLFTQYSQIIGTPEYMAPEQAEMSGLDIDTRADVYALGALLYELLTGTTLFDAREALEGGYAELLRTIREVDPERPSTRVSTLADRVGAIAARRRASPAALQKRLTNDLDWIVMKAIEKDRSRRYGSPADLAADVERFLAQEPVLAAPPSALYRLQKLVRRRTKTVAAVLAIVLLFVAGSTGTGLGWWKARVANAALSDALAEEERQRGLAEENARRAGLAEEEAHRRSRELEQVARFQAEQLGRVDPQRMGLRMRRSMLAEVPEARREAFDRELLGLNFTNLALRALDENLFDETIEAIDAAFADQPLVRADLLQTTASTMCDLGLVQAAYAPQEAALATRRAALGDDHPDTLASIHAMGYLLREQGKLDEAEPFYVEALAGRRRVLGDDDPDTLETIALLGILYQAQGRQREAEALYREALEGRRRVLGDEHPDTLQSVHNMGYFFWFDGKFDEAEPFYRESLETRRRVLGDEDPATLQSIGAMGTLLRGQGELPEAEPYFREALEGFRRIHGDAHPVTLGVVGNLAVLLGNLGRLDEGEELARESYEGRRRLLGDEHRATLYAAGNLATLLQAQGRLPESEAFTRQVLETRRRVLGSEHFETVNSINNLASVLFQQARNREAERYFREALPLVRRRLGDEHPNTRLVADSLTTVLTMRVGAARGADDLAELGDALANLGALHLTLGRPDQAEPLLAEAFDALAGALPENDLRPWLVLNDLAAAVAAQGRTAEAEAIYLESCGLLPELAARPDVRASLPPYPLGVASPRAAVQRLVELYDSLHAGSPAAGYDASAAEWRAVVASLPDEGA